MSSLDQFSNQKHINLETYKKNDQAVQTPVWFVIQNDLIYVITKESTGKVKRIKNNPSVRVVPSDMKGKPTGSWVSGKATVVNDEEAEKAIKLRKKKYGFMATVAGFLTSAKGKLVVFSIKLD